MQQGDLQLWTVPRWIVVLEGVLCNVVPITKKRKLREPAIVGYHINWHDTPLKRMVYLKEQWPENSLEIVTFIPDFIDTALEFLDAAQIPYDKASYSRFDQFCSVMRFQPDLQKVYDSDVARLDRYGQYGVAVNRGMDFH
jgi:hypothetical protein